MKVLILGGTTEGRILARGLSELGHRVTVSVATPLGAEELEGMEGLELWMGRKDEEALEQAVGAFDRCVDATHPYALLASANIRCACGKAGVPLLRLLRPESRAEGVLWADSCPEAARLLAGREGNILLTTGAKELGAFGALPKERLFVRVLPCRESLEACEALGIPHRNILALQGPFTQKMNEAMLEQYRISWLVTKDGGEAGGFPQKLSAARALGVKVVLVRRPRERGMTMEEVLKEAAVWER